MNLSVRTIVIHRCLHQITLRDGHTPGRQSVVALKGGDFSVKCNEILPKLANVASNRFVITGCSFRRFAGRRERRSLSEASFKDKCRSSASPVCYARPGRVASCYERVYRVTSCSWLRGRSPWNSDTKGNRLITPSILTSSVAERL